MKVPMRIQIWHDGTRMEIRGWLEELDTYAELSDIPYSRSVNYQRPEGSRFTVSGHTGDSWKFRRGKPEVGE